MFQNKKKDFKIIFEDQLLLNCARTKIDDNSREKILSLVNNKLNWDHIVQMASIHRLIPLLYVNLNSICPEKIPSDVLSNLKYIFHKTAKKNLLITGELLKLIKLLEINEIKALTYKGPLLAFSLYGNISYRQFGDIDIIINKSDAIKVKKIMNMNGYELVSPIKISDSYYMKLISEMQFINRNTGVLIEIKWKFEGDFISLPPDHNILLDNLNYLNINGNNILNLDPSNQLLILCIHAAKHGWLRLSWICDISELISNENIDWNLILKNAENLGVKRILLINLYLIYDLFNIKIPEKVLTLFEYDKLVKKCSMDVKTRIFQERKKSLNLLDYFFLSLKIRENWLNGLIDCFNGLTTPTYADFSDISLPENLLFIYKIIRPLLLIRRY